jgi:hypothetical protein
MPALAVRRDVAVGRHRVCTQAAAPTQPRLSTRRGHHRPPNCSRKRGRGLVPGPRVDRPGSRVGNEAGSTQVDGRVTIPFQCELTPNNYPIFTGEKRRSTYQESPLVHRSGRTPYAPSPRRVGRRPTRWLQSHAAVALRPAILLPSPRWAPGRLG